MCSKSSKLVLILVSVSIAITSITYVAQANGRVTKFQNQSIGPYLVSLGTIPEPPIVGNLHLTLTLMEIEKQEFILDALITASGNGSTINSKYIGPINAVKNFGDPRYYDINTSVNTTGTWTFDIAIKADAGEITTTFQIEVIERNNIPAILAFFVLLLLVTILGLSIRSFIQQQSKGKKRFN